MLTGAEHVMYCYSMTTDAIYEEHRYDWSHQIFAMVTTQLLQRDKTLLLCEECGLWDYPRILILPASSTDS